jgi:prepilin signal peptidase PulO-like enzyme (type II secretory pathway)
MITFMLAVLGVIFGSFVNAFVWRLHELERVKKKRPKAKELTAEELSITKGRSMCPQCHHTLAAKDLVPVLSWLQLRGKCRYCHKPISWQYPLVELATGLLFALSYIAWPQDMHGVEILRLGFWLFFVILAVYDLRWYLLPDKVVFPLIVIAAIEVVAVAVWQQSLRAVWEPALGSLVIAGLFYALFQVSKGGWIGGGDVKLAIALGLIAGSPLNAFLVIFFASLLGTLGSVPVLLQGKKGLKMHIPFGPYLLLATYIVVLYGDAIADWYTRLFTVGV